jgi:hypothetical protein
VHRPRKSLRVTNLKEGIRIVAVGRSRVEELQYIDAVEDFPQGVRAKGFPL